MQFFFTYQSTAINLYIYKLLAHMTDFPITNIVALVSYAMHIRPTISM